MASAKIKPTTKKIPVKKATKVSSVKVIRSANNGKPVFRPDSRQTATLIKAGRDGAFNAIRASKALGLSITYLRKGILYLEQPDGTKTIIANADNEMATPKKAKVQLKKGMVFHAKK